MIDRTALEDFIKSRLQGTEYFPVDITVSNANEIKVEIDSMGNVDIDYCIELSRAIEKAFPRDDEDYELEVGSAGFTSPFKVRQQYIKNIGNRVEVLTSDGRKLFGRLVEAGDDSFTVETVIKVREPGAKRPVEKTQAETFPYSGVKSVKYDFEF